MSQSPLFHDFEARLPGDFATRFWAKDPSLWPASPASEVAGMLGWISVLDEISGRFEEIDAFVAEVRAAGFTRVVLAGMGGSSLAPFVFAQTLGVQGDGLPLHVLDSTHPASVLEIAASGIETTLFIVASKSGSTAEPTAFENYFFAKARPDQFVAITDPGSPFHQRAEARGFRKIFLNYADIGGRFSALSLFGLVPAALLGIDYREVVARAKSFAAAHATGGPAFGLGAWLGHHAKQGVDKLSLVSSPALFPFALWLEQLVAESTGKQGTGLLPIAGDTVGPAGTNGPNRIFAFLDAPIPEGEFLHPVVRTTLDHPLDIGAEFLRWEIATATAGHVLGINPFDQPNVQESKDITKAVLAEIEDGELSQLEGWESSDLPGFLQPAEDGYIAIQAYVHETPAMTEALAELQTHWRNRFRVPVTVGYGPRFLHSTGQYHKGGPANGWFVQIIDKPRVDDRVPEQAATWAQFILAQALGDRRALEAKGRPVFSLSTGEDALTQVRYLLS